MKNIIVIGCQWGDEGKGRITDKLAQSSDVIVRFSGGNNAGHTVIAGSEKFELHLIPCGILYKDKINIIGNGMVVNLEALISEINMLENRGVSTDNLFISDTAHVILPHHILLDELEESRENSLKIGTTKRGIGPAYTDKVSRRGIRICDLLSEDIFESKLINNLNFNNQIISKIYNAKPVDYKEVIKSYRPYIQKLKKYFSNTSVIINNSIEKGKSILFEGAQGTLLDVDYGTYPYVTSSNPSAGGVFTGAGIGPLSVDAVYGVTKAYLTRVGEGPFPTELLNDTGKKLREVGREYGVTTGRPRRCGWLDLPLLKHSVRVNGITNLALTKLDILSSFEELKVCTHYEVDCDEKENQNVNADKNVTENMNENVNQSTNKNIFGLDNKCISNFQSNINCIKFLKPIYKSFEGWNTDISFIKNYDDLPIQAKNYIEFIEQQTSVKVSVIGIGAEREKVIIRNCVY